MRSILPLLIASSAIMASPTLDKRITTLEEQMHDLRMQSVYGNYGAETATAYPSLNSWGVYFEAEAIYWKFFEGGTDYVFVKQPNVNSSTYVDRLHYMDFDWRFAYRFTLGYQLKDPSLDLRTTFTRFTTDQSTGVDQPAGGGTLYPNQAVTANPDYTRSSESWNLSFNVLDLTVGRSYFLRRTFSAHPYMGLRGALIDQRSKATWEGSATSDFEFKSTNNFFGIGLLAGTQGRWHFDTNWSVFGSILGSLLYGWYDVDSTIHKFYLGVSNPLELESDTRRVVPNMTADAGFRWEYLAFKNRTRFALSLAYEFQYWWAQNQMIHTKNGTSYAWDRLAEDFGMQGVKLNFALDF